MYRRRTASCICDYNIVAVLIADGGSLLQRFFTYLHFIIIYFPIEAGRRRFDGLRQLPCNYIPQQQYSATNALKVYNIFIHHYTVYYIICTYIYTFSVQCCWTITKRQKNDRDVALSSSDIYNVLLKKKTRYNIIIIYIGT